MKEITLFVSFYRHRFSHKTGTKACGRGYLNQLKVDRRKANASTETMVLWSSGEPSNHADLSPTWVVLRLDKKSVDTLRIANQDINVIAQQSS